MSQITKFILSGFSVLSFLALSPLVASAKNFGFEDYNNPEFLNGGLYMADMSVSSQELAEMEDLTQGTAVEFVRVGGEPLPSSEVRYILEQALERAGWGGVFAYRGYETYPLGEEQGNPRYLYAFEDGSWLVVTELAQDQEGGPFADTSPRHWQVTEKGVDWEARLNQAQE